MRNALVSLCVWSALLAQVSLADAAASDAISALGFEKSTDWTIQNGTIIGTTETRTQGLAALAVHASGYTVLRSRLMGPLGQVASTLAFDLHLPTSPKLPWAGATQLFVSIPSLGLNEAYIGQVELGGVVTGSYQRISFRVPDTILAKLRGTYSDLSFSIVLNVPTNTANQYLLDNFEVSATIPPSSTIGLQDRLAILGFERLGWTISSGTIVGLSTKYGTEGTFSLAVNPQGYCTLVSPPLPSIGPVACQISLDLWQPEHVPTPTYGAAQLFISIPSQNVYSAPLGQVALTALPRNAMSKITFDVPSNLRPALDAAYTDLKLSIALNVPPGAVGPYYIDHLQVGNLTMRPAPARPSVNGRGDLVGKAASGLLSVVLDGVPITISIVDADFSVEQQEPGCIPSATKACRYLVNRTVFKTGGFTILGISYGTATVANLSPFEVVLGGSGASSLTSILPSWVDYRVSTSSPDNTFIVNPGAMSSITISPAGSGMIAMSGQFQGNVDGHGVAINSVVTANTPIANRPPVASAGADMTVVGTGDCLAVFTLDGSATYDPDNNIDLIRWFKGNIFVGSGATPTVRVGVTGQYVYTIVVTDKQFAQSTDQVIVNATVKTGCGTSDPPGWL